MPLLVLVPGVGEQGARERGAGLNTQITDECSSQTEVSFSFGP